jgi:O-antigen/teichoic acid export membrane protein
MRPNLLSRLASADFAVRSNVMASFAANVTAAVLTLFSVPLYIGYVGIEAYALVGLFISMQVIFAVLDLGLSAAITRELAGEDLPLREKRDLLRTSEAIYWGTAVAAALIGLALAPFLTVYVKASSIPYETLLESFLLIALCLGLQFPIGMYSAALLGMHRQVLLGAVNVIFAFIRVSGTLTALEFVSATPQTIFASHAISSALQIIVLAAAAWASMPGSESRARIKFGTASRLWKFTAGVTGITVMSVLLTQVDKIVLARILPLESFGYYAIAGVVAGSLGRFIQPVFQVYFPRLTQLSFRGDKTPLIEAYHQGSQLVSVLVLPVAAVCVFFPREVLMLWQGDAAIVANSSTVLALLTIGSSLNALLFIPYALQLAFGWTRFYFLALTTAVLLSVPVTVLLATRFGGEGAAWVWIAFNAAFVLFVVPAVHRRMVPGESGRWYLSDVLLPAAAVTLAALSGRAVFFETADRTLLLAQLGVVLALAFAAACFAAGHIRRPLLKKLRYGGASL